MDMPKPGPLHERLALLAGRWLGEETLMPSPWDPAGGTALGRVENRVALGGFAVLQDYVQSRDGQTCFEGHGVFTVDADKEEVVLYWFDSMGCPYNEFRGGFEGEALALYCDAPMGRQRVRFEWPARDRYGFRMEMSQDGTNWQCLMTGAYSREG